MKGELAGIGPFSRHIYPLRTKIGKSISERCIKEALRAIRDEYVREAFHLGSWIIECNTILKREGRIPPKMAIRLREAMAVFEHERRKITDELWKQIQEADQWDLTKCDAKSKEQRIQIANSQIEAHRAILGHMLKVAGYPYSYRYQNRVSTSDAAIFLISHFLDTVVSDGDEVGGMLASQKQQLGTSFTLMLVTGRNFG